MSHCARSYGAFRTRMLGLWLLSNFVYISAILFFNLEWWFGWIFTAFVAFVLALRIVGSILYQAERLFKFLGRRVRCVPRPQTPATPCWLRHTHRPCVCAAVRVLVVRLPLLLLEAAPCFRRPQQPVLRPSPLHLLRLPDTASVRHGHGERGGGCCACQHCRNHPPRGIQRPTVRGHGVASLGSRIVH